MLPIGVEGLQFSAFHYMHFLLVLLFELGGCVLLECSAVLNALDLPTESASLREMALSTGPSEGLS